MEDLTARSLTRRSLMLRGGLFAGAVALTGFGGTGFVAEAAVTTAATLTPARRATYAATLSVMADLTPMVVRADASDVVSDFAAAYADADPATQAGLNAILDSLDDSAAPFAVLGRADARARLRSRLRRFHTATGDTAALGRAALSAMVLAVRPFYPDECPLEPGTLISLVNSAEA